jgi:pimeloyl-ACP methyl ester carboxylesterase
VLLIHGANTPALGLLALARELQALDASAHVVLFDLWGHGLSSTPLAPHTAQIFHFQIFQVLNFMRWTGEGTDVHILGYSFGACMAARFAVHNPWAARSVALLAPAGILDKAQLSARMRELLDDGTGSRDAEAADCVLEWLEGGPLIVPADWAERVQAGQVVAEAFRAWELEEHKGYALSVLSMFREDNVYGCEDSFREFAGLSLKKVVVLGELDGVCSKSQLVDLGFDNVQVVEKANHGVVRSAAVEVARHVHRLWTEQS